MDPIRELCHGKMNYKLASELKKTDRKQFEAAPNSSSILIQYPKNCLRVFMGYLRVFMGCLRVDYGCPKSRFSLKYGFSPGFGWYEYGFLWDEYGFLRDEFGISYVFPSWILKKNDQN